ncbi:MAG: hypothetical protein H7A25_22795 [Leptospiraceae bacterium]|nr:hypothetical protein [Leptospiraceae bacterium]MCP5502745.1 hypothetical protein [Leptospiraceae bacterium]
MSFFNFVSKEEQLYLESKDNRKMLTSEWNKKGVSNYGKLTTHEYYILFNDTNALKRKLNYFEIIILSMCDKTEAEKLMKIHSTMSEDELIVSIRDTARRVLKEFSSAD